MTALSKTLSNVLKSKPLQAFAFDKASENIIETIITFITFAFTLAYLLTMQQIPVSMGECMVYMTLIFLGILLRRLVQDFDDAWTIDELGNWITSVSSNVDDLVRMVRSEAAILDDNDDDDLTERINNIANR